MATESWTLDTINLTRSPWRMRSASVPPAKSRPTWLDSPDQDGSILLEPPKAALREHVFVLQLQQTPDRDTALSHIGALVDVAQRCANTQGGVDHVWTPAGGSKSATFHALLADFDDLPLELGGTNEGWFTGRPQLTLHLYCLPFGDLAPVTVTAVVGSSALTTVILTGVEGDAPALARLILTEPAGKPRRYMEWGASADTADPLEIDAASFVTTGFAGVFSTDHVRTALQTQTVACFGLGTLGHLGTYRVHAIAQLPGNHPQAQVRLSWKDKDGDLTANPWQTISGSSGNMVDINLGLVTIATGPLGAQTWTGQIEAYAASAAGNLDVYAILLVPVDDGYGSAAASSTTTAPVIVATDDFTGTAAGSALNARTAPLGGTWATSGSTTDFTFADAGDLGAGRPLSETIKRATTAVDKRFAVLGGSRTNTQIAADLLVVGSATANESGGLLARFVDTSNYLAFDVQPDPLEAHGGGQVYLRKCVAGVESIIAQHQYFDSFNNAFSRFTMTVYSSGRVIVNLGAFGTIDVSDTALATGGTLASGGSGLIDRGAVSAAARYYDNVSIATPPAESLVLNASKTLEINDTDVWRESAAGGTYGQLATYLGSQFYLQPAGDQGRQTRVVARAAVNNLAAGGTADLTDHVNAQVIYTPRIRVVPR